MGHWLIMAGESCGLHVDSALRSLPLKSNAWPAVGFHYNRIGSPPQEFFLCGVYSFGLCVSRLRLAWQINSHGALVLSRGTDDLEVVVGAGAAKESAPLCSLQRRGFSFHRL